MKTLTNKGINLVNFDYNIKEDPVKISSFKTRAKEIKEKFNYKFN